MRRLILALAASFAASAVLADDLGARRLPSLALDPNPEVSPWHGLSIGTDVFGVLGRKGSKGFVGGSVSAGYEHVFDASVLMNLKVATGLAPGFSPFGPLRAYDFASAGAKVGYMMGRWTPYVATDLMLTKPNGRAAGMFRGMDTANDLFNSSENLDVGGSVGAGFDYALTNDVTVGLGVSVHKGTPTVFP